MDVVRNNIRRINGQVRVASAPGTGTQISIIVPLTLATTRALLVEQNGQIFAVPAAAIERNARVKPDDFVRLQGQLAVVIEDRPVPVVELADILERLTPMARGVDQG